MASSRRAPSDSASATNCVLRDAAALSQARTMPSRMMPRNGVLAARLPKPGKRTSSQQQKGASKLAQV